MKLNEPGIAEIRYVESFLATGKACAPSIFRPTHRYICLEFAAICSELRSCMKVEVAVQSSPSLISLMVLADVKQHLKKKP